MVMKGFCSGCKEDRGDDEEWGIIFATYPLCEKCGRLVDVEGEHARY